jgi:hypothetical protein
MLVGKKWLEIFSLAEEIPVTVVSMTLSTERRMYMMRSGSCLIQILTGMVQNGIGYKLKIREHSAALSLNVLFCYASTGGSSKQRRTISTWTILRRVLLKEGFSLQVTSVDVWLCQ